MEIKNCSRFTDFPLNEEGDMLNDAEAGRATVKGWQKYGLAWGTAIAMALLVLVAFTKGFVPAAAHLVKADSTALVEYSASDPDFHALFSENPVMVQILTDTQIQRDSKVVSGTFYEWRTPGAKPEGAIALLLQSIATRKVFKDLPDGCSLYWTLQIRLARKNTKSKWHSFAKSLNTGVQTIKRIAPAGWLTNQVTKWGSSASYKVLVY